MNRSTAREIAVHFVFELAFSNETARQLLDRELTPEGFARRAQDEPMYAEFPGQGELDYITRLVLGAGSHGAELDGYIEKYAKGWRFARMPLVATAIMRVAMYEMLYMEDIPTGVAINEAVELCKKYESDEVVKFVNGLLGTFAKEEIKPT